MFEAAAEWELVVDTAWRAVVPDGEAEVVMLCDEDELAGVLEADELEEVLVAEASLVEAAAAD